MEEEEIVTQLEVFIDQTALARQPALS